MDEFERDRISKGFADLTALLEGAATLAVGGQSRRQPLMSAKANIIQIWPVLIACFAALASIERIVDEDWFNQNR